MRVRLFALLILFALVSVIAISKSRTIYSQDKSESASNTLSQVEQELLNEINQARANPELYASYLEKLKPLFDGKTYKSRKGALVTNEGWAAVEDAIAFLRATKPQSPFALSTGLRGAAWAHVKEQSTSGGTGHKGGSGWIEERVKPFGTWQGGISENLSYGNESARERLLTWLIDDGFATRGHRKRVMSPDYTVAGLSCGRHVQYGSMCVLTLAGGFTELSDARRAPANGTKAADTPNNQLPTAILSVTPANSNANGKTTTAPSGAASNSSNANTKVKPR